MDDCSKTAGKLVRRIVCAALVMMLAAVLMPALVFADEDEDRAFGNLYILGRKITQNGEVPAAAVPHKGTITYDPVGKCLTLKDVTLDLDDYEMPPDVENNYAAAISAWDDLTIELQGTNVIRSSTNTYKDDKLYVFGIKSSSDEMNISGSGSLDITLQTVSGKKFTGIDANRGIYISGCKVNVSMTGTESCYGLDTGISDFAVDDGAKVKISAEGESSAAVDGCGLFERSYVADGAVLEMVSGGKAFKGYMISDQLKNTPAFVNEAATAEGAQPWDKQTGIYTYRYVRFEGEGSPERSFGSLYILGRKVETGEISADTVPHTGTIEFDQDMMKLIMTDATLDLKDFESPAVGNLVIGLYSTSSLTIELNGDNKIISTGDDYAKYGDDPDNKKEYVYGIEAWGDVTIVSTGDASLSIELAKTAKEENKDITFGGIDADGNAVIDAIKLDIDMGQYGKCDGMFLWGTLQVVNGAYIKLNADGNDGRGLNGINTIGGTIIDEKSCLEMISQGRAFNCYTPEVSLLETPCMVNTSASEQGASAWDKSTGLYNYKYVRFRDKPEVAPTEKKDSTLKVSGKTAKIKYAKLKKKAQTIKQAVTATKSHGKVTYKISSVKKAKFKKYFTISTKGDLTVKKGLKKGTYTVKVKVTDAGNSEYKPGSKTAAVKVIVK